MTTDRPRRSRKTPRIYAISPSGSIGDRKRVERACDHLAQAGFPVKLDRGAFSAWQRFAGTDEARLAALTRAAESTPPIVMATRGGYGLTRIIDRIDFEALAAADKQWVGLSDFTALHLGMLARAGAVTWAGPCLTTLETFVDCMEGRVHALGFECQGPRNFECEGTLWGGNLAMICALLGTPWFPKVRGGILFIEDTNEHPYRIERMLFQLQHAGVLDQQKAVVFGQFDNYRLALHDRGYDLPIVIERLRRNTPAAVISGLPFGHGSPCLTLPHGAKIGLAIERKTCYLVFPQDHQHDGHDHDGDDHHDHGHDHDDHGHHH